MFDKKNIGTTETGWGSFALLSVIGKAKSKIWVDAKSLIPYILHNNELKLQIMFQI